MPSIKKVLGAVYEIIDSISAKNALISIAVFDVFLVTPTQQGAYGGVVLPWHGHLCRRKFVSLINHILGLHYN